MRYLSVTGDDAHVESFADASDFFGEAVGR
jgi:hypothetical protein